MSDYTPSGDPLVGSRAVSSVLRDEFEAIATAVNSKQDINALVSTSITPTAIPGSVPNNVSMTWETGKAFRPGYYVTIVDTALPATNNMFGLILSYNSTSGAATVQVTSKNGSGTISAWTIVTTSQSGVTLGSNTFTGFQNFARATVSSHATTADIWNALGNQINFTGTATVTDFPDAPQGGAVRELICAGACSFTAGSDMLIDGVSSGNTVTCAANDVVIVRAISTTQFRLTRIRYDGLAQKHVASNLRAHIYLGNGTGSSSTNVRLMTTTAENTLNATIAHSATAGSSITVPVSGMYFFQGRDYYVPALSGLKYFGISRNATSGLTTGGSLSVLALGSTDNTNTVVSVSGFRYLDANDVVRLLNVNPDTLNGTDHTMLAVTLVEYV